MSRTYRNKARFTHLNEAHYIEEQLNKFNIRYDVEHFWLPGMEEKYKADYAKYEKDLARYHKSDWMFRPQEPLRYLYRGWYKKLKEFDQKEYDEEVKETRRNFKKYSRDGRWNETGRNKGFKHACKKADRSKTRTIINNIKHGKADFDEVCFPDKKDGKCRIWDFW